MPRSAPTSAKCCGCSASAKRPGASGTSRSRPARTTRRSKRRSSGCGSEKGCSARSAPGCVRPGRDQATRRSARVLARGPHCRALPQRSLHREHLLAPRQDRRRAAHHHAHGPGCSADRAARRRRSPQDRRAARVPRRRFRVAHRARARLPGADRGSRRVGAGQAGAGAGVARLARRVPGIRRAASPAPHAPHLPGHRAAPRNLAVELTWYPAPGKLNLFLHVLGRRPDGYHELQTVFRLIDRADRVGLSARDDGEIRFSGPFGEQNLCVRAARLLQSHTGSKLGCDLALEKHLPVGGGLGGGSSDAATVLLALNRLWKLGLSRAALQDLGLKIGADVPVFVYGKNALGEGIGERLRSLELGPAWYLVLTPQVSVSTEETFKSALTLRSKRLT